jgi:hypothetical protein
MESPIFLGIRTFRHSEIKHNIDLQRYIGAERIGSGGPHNCDKQCMSA